MQSLKSRYSTQSSFWLAKLCKTMQTRKPKQNPSEPWMPSSLHLACLWRRLSCSALGHVTLESWPHYIANSEDLGHC